MVHQVAAHHLRRLACLYVRQSTLQQVFENTESTARQYALRERALALGWAEERILVIDQDLGVLSELKPDLGKVALLLVCSSSKKRVEQGALADELSLLCGHNDQEADEENQTGLQDVLLPLLLLYVQ